MMHDSNNNVQFTQVYTRCGGQQSLLFNKKRIIINFHQERNERIDGVSTDVKNYGAQLLEKPSLASDVGELQLNLYGTFQVPQTVAVS
jgi:hypothetical protein